MERWEKDIAIKKNIKRERYAYRSRLAHNLRYFLMETEIFGQHITRK